jgi:hypothetical protein
VEDTVKYLPLAIAAFLLSCGTASANEVHDVKCKVTSKKCVDRARGVCGGHFNVLHSESHAGGLLGDKTPGPIRWYTLVYECPNSKYGDPEFSYHGSYSDPEPEQELTYSTRQRTSVGSMQKYCQGEAAARFGQRPQNILTLPVERNGGGFTVYGQFPPEGRRVTTFECSFDHQGLFRRVARN